MKKLIISASTLILAACTTQTPVTGIVGANEVFAGTATRTYPSKSGELTVASDKGVVCSGKFSYYGKGSDTGTGRFTCTDGRVGTYRFVTDGHEGQGTGKTINGQDVEFYFNKDAGK